MKSSSLSQQCQTINSLLSQAENKLQQGDVEGCLKVLKSALEENKKLSKLLTTETFYLQPWAIPSGIVFVSLFVLSALLLALGVYDPLSRSIVIISLAGIIFCWFFGQRR